MKSQSYSRNCNKFEKEDAAGEAELKLKVRKLKVYRRSINELNIVVPEGSFESIVDEVSRL